MHTTTPHDPAPDATPRTSAATEGSVALQGLGVSAGTASAPVVRVVPAPGPDPHEPPCTDPAADGQRVREAMEQVAQALRERAEDAHPTAAEVLRATAQLASDRGLAKAVDKQLAAGRGLTAAVQVAVEGYAAKLTKLGGYMAERVTDLEDVRDRTVCRLRGLPEPGVPQVTAPAVLVAEDLAPADTATLDPQVILGIVTRAGGPTSHTAILAAQLGIPAVVRVDGAQDLHTGEVVALDGGTGEVLVRPTPQQVEQFANRARRRAQVLAGSAGPGTTADGHAVKLLANIGTAKDAEAAAAQDVQGTGLFRTEFLFLDRSQAPSLQEQTQTYAQVLRAFDGRRVVVRTLDAGADKPLSFADLGPEENPALGVRGLRLARERSELLTTQLQALAEAHRQEGGDLWVMAPMVATVEEARWFAEQARACGLPHVGVMIEVPGAALLAGPILAEVDFVSLGTNDLSQYTMAADRMDGRLASLLDPWQPALLHLVQFTCAGAGATGAPVGVCGEAGGDPLLALVLVGLGVTSLSMAPSRVAAVRSALAMHSLATCREMARVALTSTSAHDARSQVLALAEEEVAVLL